MFMFCSGVHHAILCMCLCVASVFESLGAFNMDCGCMKRPARVAACSRGGVENGSVKSDISVSRGLLR